MASLEDVKSLMKDVGWGAMATTDGQHVGVRPMAGWAWMDGELWCATGEVTDKVAQLKAVPEAEYCFVNASGQHVRLNGPCRISRDLDDKKRLYEAVPILKQHVSDPADPDYVVIRMKPQRIRAMFDLDLSYEQIAPE